MPIPPWKDFSWFFKALDGLYFVVARLSGGLIVIIPISLLGVVILQTKAMAFGGSHCNYRGNEHARIWLSKIPFSWTPDTLPRANGTYFIGQGHRCFTGNDPEPTFGKHPFYRHTHIAVASLLDL